MQFSNLLTLQGQLFLLLTVGAIARQLQLFDKRTKQLLTDLVLYIALPCSIIRSFQIQVSGDLSLLCSPCSLSLLPSRRKLDLLQGILSLNRSLQSQGSSLCNPHFECRIYWYPHSRADVWPSGIYVCLSLPIPQRVMMWSAGLAIFNSAPEQEGGSEERFTASLHGCSLCWSIFIGQWLASPRFVENTLDSLGGATTALSMLLIGSLFAEMDRDQLVLDKNLFSFSIIRLFLIPFITLIGCHFAGIDPMVASVSIILSGMPGGSSTVILASKYGGDTIYASKLVIISTAFSLISISLWALALQ